MRVHEPGRTVGKVPGNNSSSRQETHTERRMWLPLAATLLALCAALVATGRNQGATTKLRTMPEPPPYWAYAVNPPEKASHAKPDDKTLRHVPRSSAAFTLRHINDGFNPPDWHPDGHPPMPDVVAHGSKPEVLACGYCHLPNGQGRPENASLAGLPEAYIIQQMADFKSGLRKTSKSDFLPATHMDTHESKANRREVRAAAKYFSRLTPEPWIRVVESATVPKTHVAGWMLVPTAGAGKEPIGHRIIETPVNVELTEMRDDASPFIAYVPMGSIEKGKQLAITGGAGKTMACDVCHGRDLMGSGNVASIAGRSPSYIVRQLYDFQSGARSGPDAMMMKPVVNKLTLDDMISLAAYLASLHP